MKLSNSSEHLNEDNESKTTKFSILNVKQNFKNAGTAIKNGYLDNASKATGFGAGVIVGAALMAVILTESDKIDMETRHKIALAIAIALFTAIIIGAAVKLGMNAKKGQHGEDIDENRSFVKQHSTIFERNPKKTAMVFGLGLGAVAATALCFYGQDFGVDMDQLTNDKVLFGFGLAILTAIAAVAAVQATQFIGSKIDKEYKAHVEELNRPSRSESILPGPLGSISRIVQNQGDKMNGNKAFIGAGIGAAVAAIVMETAMKDADIATKLIVAAAIILTCALIASKAPTPKLNLPCFKGNQGVQSLLSEQY